MTASSASAFHLQFGVSGYGPRNAEWLSASVEVGAKAEFIIRSYDNSHIICCSAKKVIYDWRDPLLYHESIFSLQYEPCGGLTFYPVIGTSLSNLKRSFVAEECVSLGTVGDGTLCWSNVVVTVRGDPYSVVMNDTSAALTVNGETIPAGGSKSLLFPAWLVMSRDDRLKFYDLESGAEINTNLRYSTSNSAYLLNWSGNIRISDGSSPESIDPFRFALLYGGMAAENADRLLFASNGQPVRPGYALSPTNVSLKAWWDFDQGEWGITNGPVAYLDGTPECYSHTTVHVIPHDILSGWVRTADNDGYVDFTMRITPAEGFSGGACVMRVWDASFEGAEGDSYAAVFAAVPAAHKAEVSAGLGTAKFRVKMNMTTGAWSVTALTE